MAWRTSAAGSMAALIAVIALPSCYTRLYREDYRSPAEWDSVTARMDSAAAAGDTGAYLPGPESEPERYYRGYPYELWFDPFYDHPRRYRWYWEYYYDPYWGYRYPYPRYYPYPPHRYPRRRYQPQPGRPSRPPNLYPPAPQTPPPERGRRREGSEGSRPPPETRDDPGASRPEGPRPGESGTEERARPGAADTTRSIPPPDRGRRR